MKMKPMDPTWKKKWIKALRTPVEEGGYIQGRGRLVQPVMPYYMDEDMITRDNPHVGEDSFCCLGVVKNLLVQAGHGSWTDKVVQRSLYSLVYEDAGSLSDEDREVLGISIACHARLTELNDEVRASLVYIADWIEMYQ